ncbi:PREDICTED: zinc finger MYM-type protein 1-like [Amphimedon queenslandica]|uniref:DUF4371 domain-containing protein n=1 Tax=Amphimedon queenslandica TaxID=400682 RepID=A0A1X7T141_AMPQE|nr:PREDICTED: zinc finger MYM-type protein 1-like [Amphimedon queenslandica]|eukprot:XP_011408430.1 PREDICTED: zinc finger MYM-type protein 1-like [Amphimedon queenslandica]
MQNLSLLLACLFIFSGLDTKGLVCQGYDGASVMAGKNTGVQQCIKEVAPQAIYVHCHAHCLNLVLVDCAKSVPDADESFQLLQLLYVFIYSSKAHEIYISKQSELHADQQVRQMQRLSDTRWACRYAAVESVCSTYDLIFATIESIKDVDDKAKFVEANGILFQIRSLKFVFILAMFLLILSCTKRLSDELQCKDIVMAKAVELITATIQTINEFRGEKCWEQIVQY